MNSVNMIGRIATDLTLNYSTSGVAICGFNLAVKRPFSEDTDFFRIVTFKNIAENLVKYQTKGNQIGVQGHLQTRSYENSQGQKINVVEVVANNVFFIESKKDETNTGPMIQNKPPKQQKQQKQSNNYLYENSNNFNISDDDLPF